MIPRILSLIVLVATSSAQLCTPCFGGTEPTNPDGRSALGLTCEFFIDETVDAPANARPCESAQIATFQGCGCPAYDEAVFCNMCNDAFYEINNRNKRVPLFPNKTCGDILFPRRDSGICADVERAAYHCGCPNASEPVCSFCPAGDAPTQRQALLPPHFNQTCEDLHILAPFSISNESCAALTADLPINTELYCGCEPVDPTIPVACSLCGNENIQYPDWTVQVSPSASVTCAEVGRLAETATDGDFCASLVDDFNSTCCFGIRPTQSPTPVPVETDVPTTFPLAADTPSPSMDSSAFGGPFWPALVSLAMGSLLFV